MSGEDFAITLGMTVALPGVVYVNSRINFWTRKSRLDQMDEIEKLGMAAYSQKQQRRMWMWLCMAVYFLGAAVALSFQNDPAMIYGRATVGALAAICGAIAGSSARVSNEYGVQRQREQSAAIDRKQQETSRYKKP